MLNTTIKALGKYKAILLVALFLYTPPVLAATSPASAPIKLENPLKVTSLDGLLVAILNIIIVIAIPIIVLFIIYSGFLYVTAKGNAAQVEQATRSFTYAIIGAVLIIGSVAIAQIVKNLVSAF